MNKTLAEAFDLIESMASHHFQWSNERQVVPASGGIHHISADDSIAAQVELLNKQMANIMQNRASSSSSSVYSVSPVCDVCGQQGHVPGDRKSVV